jgi:imidazolonepropionase
MSLLITNIAELATPHGMVLRGAQAGALHIIHDAAVYVDGDTVCEVGARDAVEKKISGNPTVIDAAGKTVIPGLVDSHTHLVFAGSRETEFAMRCAGMNYQTIAAAGGGILSSVSATRAASVDELKSAAKHYLALALAHGTTTMEIKSGYGLDTETELKILDVIQSLSAEQPVELVPTFLGAHAIPQGKTSEAYVKELLEMLPHVKGKAQFIDAFVEENYFSHSETETLCRAAIHHGLKPRLHVNQLTANDGVRLGLKLGAASVDHLEKITDDEIRLLANSDCTATLLPAVSFFLNYGYPPARALIDAGAIVAIASNFNPGSAMTLNMQLVMSIACTQMRLTPAEALVTATLNPAYSLGVSEKIGGIEIGKQADLVIMDVQNHQMIPYFFGVNHVQTVIKKGTVVYSR